METTLWIARDGNGQLHVFGRKPSLRASKEKWVIACLHCKLQEEGFCARYSICGKPLPIDMYPEVTLENSPIELVSNISE